MNFNFSFLCRELPKHARWSFFLIKKLMNNILVKKALHIPPILNNKWEVCSSNHFNKYTPIYG